MAQLGIQNYYQSIQKHGFLRNFHFRILSINGTLLAPLNAEMMGNNMEGAAYLTTSTVPARTITNQAVPFMGLDFNVPGSAKYTGSDAWSVTFRTPGDMLVRNALEQMNFNIFDDATSTGAYGVPCAENVISLALLNVQGEAIRQYDLYGVYPVSVGEIAFDLTGDGAPVEFTSTLAYQFFRVKRGSGNLVKGPAGTNAFATGNSGQNC
jgi:hypothetical protein